jgi:iron complex transport system substrate-binding protein
VLPRLLSPALPLVLALGLGFAACGGSGGETGGAPAATESPATTESAATQPAATETAEPAFPVTIEAENGSVVLEARPERIVSLSPTATESLFAIGAGDQVIAVDDQSNFPAGAPVTDLSGFTPNIEAIASYEPDLVVAGFDPGELVEGLEKIGVTVLLQPAAADLEDAYEQIEELGEATGHPEAAELVESMQTEIEALAASLPAAADGLSVYHELGPDFFSATSKTFIGSVYRLLGFENIADEASGAAPDYPQLSAEYIVSADPDLIVLADSKCCNQTPESVAKRPGWKEIGAVSEGNVVPVDDDIASRWGPRTVDFVEVIVEAATNGTE